MLTLRTDVQALIFCQGEPPISQSYILPGSGPASPVKRQRKLAIQTQDCFMTTSVMPLTVLQLYNHDPITIISVTSCILSRLDQNLAEKNRVHAKSFGSGKVVKPLCFKVCRKTHRKNGLTMTLIITTDDHSITILLFYN